LGAAGGLQAQSHTLAYSEMPIHNHSAGIYDPHHSHSISPQAYLGLQGSGGVGPGGSFGLLGAQSALGAATGVRLNSSTGGLDTTENSGGGLPFSLTTLGPRKLCTFYIKL
jgi:hypothetical protein